MFFGVHQGNIISLIKKTRMQKQCIRRKKYPSLGLLYDDGGVFTYYIFRFYY